MGKRIFEKQRYWGSLQVYSSNIVNLLVRIYELHEVVKETNPSAGPSQNEVSG